MASDRALTIGMKLVGVDHYCSRPFCTPAHNRCRSVELDRDGDRRERKCQSRGVERRHSIPGLEPLPKGDRAERENRCQASAKSRIDRLQRFVEQREEAEPRGVERNDVSRARLLRLPDDAIDDRDQMERRDSDDGDDVW